MIESTLSPAERSDDLCFIIITSGSYDTFVLCRNVLSSFLRKPLRHLYTMLHSLTV